MPQIPVFQVNPGEVPGAPAPAQANPGVMGMVGEAQAQGGAQLSDQMAAWNQRYTEVRRATDAANITANFTPKLADLRHKWSMVPDRAAAAAGFQQDAQQLRSQFVDPIQDPLVKNYATQQFDRTSTSMQLDAEDQAFGLESSQAKGNLLDRLNTYRNLYASAGDGPAGDASRADIRDKAFADIAGVAASHHISPAEAEQIRLQTGGEQDFGRASQMLDQARETGDAAAAQRASDAIADPQQFPYLTAYHREGLTRRIDIITGQIDAENERQQQQAQVQLQAQVRTRLGDEFAAIADRGTGIGVMPGEIRAAFPDQADGILKELNSAHQLYADKTRLALTSPAEDQALLAKYQPSGEGYADQVKVRNSLERAMQAKYGALGKDPAGYVLQASPNLRGQFDAAAKDPSQMPLALNALDAAQQKLGVPDYERRVLSDGQASDLVASITSQEPAAAASTLQTMAGQYGDHWPAAFRDLTAAHLPSGYQVLATIDDPAGRVQFANALQTGTNALKEAAGKDNVKDIGDAVPDALAPFARSLRFNGGMGNTYQSVAQGVSLLAYQYAAAGMPPDKAVNEAARVIVNSKYDFLDQPTPLTGPGFSIRVPKGQLAPIEDYASAAVTAMKPGDLMPVQPGRIGAALGMSADDQRPEVRQQLQHEAFVAARRGTWVTTPNVDGLVLMDSRGLPVLRKDGTPFGFKFGAALAAPPTGGTGAAGDAPPWGGL